MVNNPASKSWIMNAPMIWNKPSRLQMSNSNCPLHLRGRNAAERAIYTLKNHLIAGLCTCGSCFPASYWDKLLPQALITLNLLHSSRRNPSLSAYVAIYGNFDFNATLLDSHEVKVVVHHKSANLLVLMASMVGILALPWSTTAVYNASSLPPEAQCMLIQ